MAGASRIVSSWSFRVLFLLLWTVAVQIFLWGKLYYTGDEPHYMMSVLSFVTDGDFNEFNNYQRGDQALIGHPNLKPQWAMYGFAKPDLIPAEHGTVFPLMIAPAYKLGGLGGVRVFLVLLSAAGCLLTAAFVDALSGSALAGTLGLVLLALSPTWQMQASRIYPENIAGVFTMIVLLLFGRHVARPDRRMSALSVFALGFLTAFLPVLYVKYIALGAALGITALLLPEVRKRPALYAGVSLAVVVGAVNIYLWGDEGAVGGNFGSTLPHLFAIGGFFERYWKPFLDRHHGVVPYQPYVLLVLWAGVWMLKPPENRRATVLFGTGLAALFYTAMHGVWTTGPGLSMPGRYFAAVMPVFCAAVAIWAMQLDELRRFRLAIVGCGAAVSVAFYVASIANHLPPYFVLQPYRLLFSRYWDSWELNSAQEVTGVGLVGYYIAVAVLLTKAGAYFWLHRRELRSDERAQRLPPRLS
jgi:hypothetical protein